MSAVSAMVQGLWSWFRRWGWPWWGAFFLWAALLGVWSWQRHPQSAYFSQLSPQEKAFLDTIAYAEGTGDRYNMLFGGGRFYTYRTHPQTCIRFRTRSGQLTCSTAAGRYQILDKTHEYLSDHLGLEDFTPDTQDRMAIALIKEKGALEAVQAEEFTTAACLVGEVWASFPCNQYNQPQKPLAELEQVFQHQLKYYRHFSAVVAIAQHPKALED